MKNDNKIDLEDLPIEVLFKYLLKDGNYTLITQNRKIFPNIIWILCK